MLWFICTIIIIIIIIIAIIILRNGSMRYGAIYCAK